MAALSDCRDADSIRNTGQQRFHTRTCLRRGLSSCSWDRCGQIRVAVFNWGVSQMSDCGRRHWRPAKGPLQWRRRLVAAEATPALPQDPPVPLLQVARSRQHVRFDRPGKSFDFVEFPLSTGSLTFPWHLESLVACVCFSSPCPPFLSAIRSAQHISPWRVARLGLLFMGSPSTSASLCPFSSHLPVVSPPLGSRFRSSFLHCLVLCPGAVARLPPVLQLRSWTTAAARDRHCGQV